MSRTTPPTTAPGADQTGADAESAIIRVVGASKTFTQGDEEITALHPTDLTIGAGQFVAILGPSGSGKSTLLTIMGGLRAPSAGEVLITGRPFSTLPEKKRARIRHRSIGFILQAASLVPFLTVEDQLLHHDRVERRRPRPDRADELFDALGIAKHRRKYPADLSGGERQRAAIAAALYHDPELILADEPTAALDSHRAMDVATILADLTHERAKATVMVTHDERLIAVCDRVLVMEDGVLTER
ncbi:ABC transporter ATP-binding protein [Actinomyces sp. B33]|uniref:ABC transporter ATP-binding protein n=1 Tax=Actinomyces sp. B33 TaxID=2942131 RepID=UPI00233FE5E9|nr:ABC transporter ATP-binding protein [Actinomyces sp. B33]MDC4232328.1 ABC transporter ATP-binding protein [Actinomyces sp. B33]